MSRPLVSVCVITYNQEKFLPAALESVLMQKTNFPFEIIIGDDCSRDATPQIVREFIRKCTHPVKYIRQYRNLGALGKFNYIKTLEQAQGKYIALLEGDDCWLSEDKLQKQADILEANPDTAICFGNSLIHNEETKEKDRPFNDNQQQWTSLPDLLKENYMTTCSVMFRNNNISNYPRWFFDSLVTDYPLHILNASLGDIYYIDEILSCYRIHSGGVWSATAEKRTSEKLLLRWRNRIELYDALNQHFEGKYSEIIRNRIVELFRAAVGYLFRNKRFSEHYDYPPGIILNMKSPYRKALWGELLSALTEDFLSRHYYLAKIWNKLAGKK